MANLAFKGHETRGREVIKVLEMLGGKERISGILDGNAEISWYYINESGYIDFKENVLFDYDNTVVFTLEEFLEKFPYKVGDKVQDLKSGEVFTINYMFWHEKNCLVYYFNPDNLEYCTAEELNKYNEPYKEETMEEKSVNHVYNVDDVDVISFDIAQKDIYELDLKDNFLVILREGKYYVERIKPKYYHECYEIMDISENKLIQCGIYGYKAEMLSKFQQLLICRDAYWKIAGEQMGLEKPWKPNWENYDECKYCLYITDNNVNKGVFYNANHILAFPTEEICDIFFENFKELIEECKELL